MNKAEQMLEFITSKIAEGFTIHICTAYRTIAVTPKKMGQFKAAGKELFKIDGTGALVMAAGSKWNAICFPQVVLVGVRAIK